MLQWIAINKDKFVVGSEESGGQQKIKTLNTDFGKKLPYIRRLHTRAEGGPRKVKEIREIACVLYRVTIHVVPNLLLTQRQSFRISTCTSYSNGALVLMSTGGWEQHEWSPCSINEI